MSIVSSLFCAIAVVLGPPCPDVEPGPAITWEGCSPDTRLFAAEISWEALEGSPPWRESEPNPPFPAREALNLAEKEKSRLVKDSPQNGIFWYLDRVTLTPWEGRWYWKICYKVHYDRDRLYGLTLAVLMDGTLVQTREYGVRDDESPPIDWTPRRGPPPLPVKAKVYSWFDGRDFVTTISCQMLRRSPPWRPDEANPPLPPRKALALAEREKARLIRPSAGRDTVWSLEGISLVPQGDDRWYWVVEFWGSPGGALGGLPSVLNLVVLMDGTLVPPKELRHPGPHFLNRCAAPPSAENRAPGPMASTRTVRKTRFRVRQPKPLLAQPTGMNARAGLFGN